MNFRLANVLPLAGVIVTEVWSHMVDSWLLLWVELCFPPKFMLEP